MRTEWSPPFAVAYESILNVSHHLHSDLIDSATMERELFEEKNIGICVIEKRRGNKKPIIRL